MMVGCVYRHIQNIDKNYTEYRIDKIEISMTPPIIIQYIMRKYYPIWVYKTGGYQIKTNWDSFQNIIFFFFSKYYKQLIHASTLWAELNGGITQILLNIKYNKHKI